MVVTVKAVSQSAVSKMKRSLDDNFDHMHGRSDAMKWSPILKMFRVTTNSVPLKTSNCVQFNHCRAKMYLHDLKTQFVPRCKDSVSVIKTSQLMLYSEIIAFCPQTHTKHIGQNVELLNVKSGGMYSNQWATKG